MADPFLAEIRIYPFDFPPRGWAFCNGQIMSITQNTALFSLLGTYYGGDGMTNFGLPNLQNSVPMHWGQGPGLSDYVLGQSGGADSVTLSLDQMSQHTHAFQGANPSDFADLPAPGPDRVIGKSQNALAYQTDTTQNLVSMSPQAIQPQGKGLPHNTMMPYLTLNFCIALRGIYPPRG